jgi:hypothetical protein
MGKTQTTWITPTPRATKRFSPRSARACGACSSAGALKRAPASAEPCRSSGGGFDAGPIPLVTPEPANAARLLDAALFLDAQFRAALLFLPTGFPRRAWSLSRQGERSETGGHRRSALRQPPAGRMRFEPAGNSAAGKQCRPGRRPGAARHGSVRQGSVRQGEAQARAGQAGAENTTARLLQRPILVVSINRRSCERSPSRRSAKGSSGRARTTNFECKTGRIRCAGRARCCRASR